ncbi:MAG: hypothetical protein IPH78_09010 [Bacteroidetes bacterium]|nr:hypothetical protein [Bacteroidota bacterium]
MSKQKTNSSFLTDGQIGEQDMLAYLRNELSAAQRQQFEKLLSEDPFAQEALEGLQTAESVNAAGRIAGIRQRVREKTGVKEPRLVQMHWINYAYAAVVFGVLVGIGFLIVQWAGNNKNELALHKPEATMQEQVLFEEKTDTAAAITTSDALTDTLAATAPVAEDLGSGVKQNVKQDQVAGAVAPPVKTVPAAAAGATMNSTLVTSSNADVTVSGTASSKGLAKEPAKVEEAKMQREAERTETLVATEAAARKATNQKKAEAEKAAPATTLDDAMKSFNSASYQKASEQFDEVLKRDPDNSEALYFGGISDYLNGKSAKSEKSFDRLVKTNRYTEGSKWYKANILLKKGKKEEATKILNELSGSAGMYKERALKKLEEIK